MLKASPKDFINEKDLQHDRSQVLKVELRGFEADLENQETQQIQCFTASPQFWPIPEIAKIGQIMSLAGVMTPGSTPAK
jgi:hypothetical protein